MKKKVIIMAITITAALSTSMTSFAAGWQQDAAGWWWQDDDGSYPANTWRWLDGNGDGVAECYYFDNSGYMLANTKTPDGYSVNGSGAWVENGVVQTQASNVQQGNVVSAETTKAALVPINQLANLASLKKRCTDQEFQAAYDAAAQLVTPLIGMSTEDQLYGIAYMLRYMSDSGMVVYSDTVQHYNDPYGYLVAGAASCAGCTRTTGLCLNMLGIPYEHVHENQWCHQWCRVNVNGTYWICDAYGLYVGPEPAPYVHPYVQ